VRSPVLDDEIPNRGIPLHGGQGAQAGQGLRG
jgi:hypothetical protein